MCNLPDRPSIAKVQKSFIGSFVVIEYRLNRSCWWTKYFQPLLPLLVTYKKCISMSKTFSRGILNSIQPTKSHCEAHYQFLVVLLWETIRRNTAFRCCYFFHNATVAKMSAGKRNASVHDRNQEEDWEQSTN